MTVRELVGAFEKVNGCPINKKEAGPRPGDVAGSFASCALAESHIGWRSELSIEQGISDALKWAITWDERCRR